MKIDVQSFFDGYDEDAMEIKNQNIEKTDINTERIKELTMNKINGEKKIKLKKPVRVALIAAAVMAVLAGTVGASAALGFGVKTNVGEKEYDGYSYSDIGAEFTVPSSDREPVFIGFRTAYQPEMNEANVEETVFSMKETAYDNANRFVLSEILGSKDFDEVWDLNAEKTDEIIAAYMERNGITAPYCDEDLDAALKEADAYWESLGVTEKINSLLARGGITDELTKDAYTHIFRSDGNKSWGVDVYGTSAIDQTYIVEGVVETVKEGNINGMGALYLIDHHEQVDRPVNIIAMRDEVSGALIVVYGTSSFEELEKTAEGIELVETTMPVLESDGFNGIIAGNAQG